MAAAEAASEWLTRYAEELGRAPVCAEHLQAFVAHRGGRLPYRSALEAVVQASGRPIDQLSPQNRRHRNAPEGGQRRSFNRISGTTQASTAFGGLNTLSSRQSEQSERTLAMQRLFALGAQHGEGVSEEALRGLLPAHSSSSSENIEAAIRRFLMAFEQEVQAAADDEISRLLAALPSVNKSARHRECPICMESSEDGDSTEEGECCDDKSDQDEHSDVPAKGWVGLPCAHIFHQECLRRWFRQSVHKRTCPLCRLDLCSLSRGRGAGHADAAITPRTRGHQVASPELNSETQQVQPLSGIAGDGSRADRPEEE